MSDGGSLRARSIQAVLWRAVQGWGSQLIGLVVFLILARLLAPSDFGLLAMATVFVAFAGVFMDQGLGQALIQRRDIEEGHRNSAFWINAASGVVLAIAGVLAAPLIADIYSQPELTPILRALCVVLLLRSGSAVQTALLERDLDYRALALRNFAGLIAGGVVGVGMALSGYGVWSLVGQQLANTLVLTVTLWWMCPWKPSLRFSRRHAGDIYRFGLSIVGVNLTGFFIRQSDHFIIGYHLGPTALGYYALAFRVLQIMTGLLSGVSATVALPVFSTLQGDLARLRAAFMTAVSLSALIAFPAFVGLAALAPTLLPMMFGQKWEASVSVMQVLAIVGLLQSTLYFNRNLIVSQGKPHWQLALNTAAAIVNVLALLLAVRYGIVAVAIAFVLRAYAFAPVTIALTHRLVGLDFPRYARSLLAPLAASIVTAVCARLIGDSLTGHLHAVARMILAVGVGAAVYVGVAWLLAPAACRELFDTLQRLLRRRRGTPASTGR